MSHGKTQVLEISQGGPGRSTKRIGFDFVRDFSSDFAFDMSGFIQIFIFAGFLASALPANVGKLPPSFEICHTKQPKYDVCLLNAVEKAVQSLVKGYPPLGIHSIDPLSIIELDIDQGNGPISIKLKFKDLKISGFRDAKLSNIQYDIKNYKYAATAKVPKVVLKGNYNINGKVLILPIFGNGTCSLVLDNVTARINLNGKESKKGGKIYMVTDHFDFKFDTTKLSMKFENLFNGDKQLGDNMNVFLNENWDEILAELKPAIQDVFGAAFAQISNRIFTKVPYGDIFPE
ncbi:hypothetical protein RUM43_011011 [Polyplax serrata]|uniref:Protein takeout n=1 Tax=Polyplax serrata TaxID=468196 RepID=A0AAN8S7N2_POLSC